MYEGGGGGGGGGGEKKKKGAGAFDWKKKNEKHSAKKGVTFV